MNYRNYDMTCKLTVWYKNNHSHYNVFVFQAVQVLALILILRANCMEVQEMKNGNILSVFEQ